MTDAWSGGASWLFGVSAFLLTARLRYLHSSGAFSANVKVIADKQSSILDLLSDYGLPSLQSYSPSLLSAFDIHGMLASAVPVVVRHLYRLLRCKVRYKREILSTQGA